MEEVALQVEAKDDFGLKSVELHYSVNGGAEKTMPLAAGSKSTTGTAALSLEDFKLEPGDVVSLYATAKDARTRQNTDIYFIEAQPFEKNYSQAQSAGGGGGGGAEQAPKQSLRRPKDVIPATCIQMQEQGVNGAA